MRQKADSFSPDPQTAHTADQVISGVGSGITRAVGAIGTLGPAAGATAFGLSEADTTYQRLIDKGIEPGAAAKVAGVTGVAAGVGAVLPMAGPTVAKTLGLVAAGGPGLYAAQEIMARSILQKAGETAEAGMHDPLDPLGLALSVAIPGVFGGAHIAKMARAARQPAPTLAGVVESLESGGRRFGADGQVLTSPKGAQGEMQVMPATARDPGFGVAPAKDGSAEELARVGRDYIAALEQKYGDADKALAAYNAGPGAVDAAIAKHGDDWLAHLPDETQKYVSKGRAKLGEDTVAHAADDPATVDAARVLVGERRVAESLPDEPGAYGEMLRAGDAVAAGDHPVVEPMISPAEREANFKAWFGESKVVDEQGQPLVVYHGTKADIDAFRPPDSEYATPGHFFTSNPEFAAAYAGQKEGANITPTVISIKKPFVIEGDWNNVVTPESRNELVARGYDGIIHINKSRGVDTSQYVVFDPRQIKSAIGNSGRFDPNSASLTDPLPRAPVATPETARPVLPDAQQVTRAEPVATKAAAPDALSTLDAERVKTLAAEQPDMMVTLPGHDEPMRLADAMETAKQEADRIRSDAELVRVAAACALENGATGLA